MPIIKSAKKAARQAKKRTEHNQEIKKAIKAAIKDFKKNPTIKSLSKAQSELDKAVKKDLIKKNTAARRKSELHKVAKAADLKLTKSSAKPAAKKPAVKKPAAKTTKKPATKKTQSKSTAKKA